MAGKKIVKRIKESLSLGSKSLSPQPQPPILAHASSSLTPFTTFVISHLDDEESKVYAMTFAPQIERNCDALDIDFDNVFHLLGHKTKGNALRTLTSKIPDSERLFIKSDKNSGGRRRDVHMISINQLEEVLLAANTAAGRKWRNLVLKIKNLVVRYMKMEMDVAARLAQQQLKEQMAKLAIEEAKCTDLEHAQSELHNALQAEKERRASLKALRENDDEPNQTAYLMISGAFQTYVKIGKTGDEGDKRKKELQTGNPEEIRVFFEKKCIDSKLVERCLHHMFRWYKRRGEWYEIDKEKAKYYMTLLADLLDGSRRVEHENADHIEACQKILEIYGLDAPQMNVSEPCDEEPNDEWLTFRNAHLKRGRNSDVCGSVVLKVRFKEWFKERFPDAKLPMDKTITMYFERHLGSKAKNNHLEKGTLYGWKGWILTAR